MLLLLEPKSSYTNRVIFRPIQVIILSVLLLLSCEIVFSQNKTIENSGDVLLIAIPVSAIAITLFKNDYKGTWQLTKGLLLTEGITYGLKVAITKSRPDFSNKNSFPSGHTSTVFQSAAFIHKRYGLKKSLPFYALAGYTAFSRINAKKHDGLDILAGAIIGVGSSYLFTTPYQREHMELTLNRDK